MNVSANTVTINPTANLESSQGYYIQVAPTALDDNAGNSFAGINDNTTLSFTAADILGPSVVLAGPSGVVSGAFDVIATFSESVTGLCKVRWLFKRTFHRYRQWHDLQLNQPEMETTVTVSIAAGVAQDLQVI